MKIFFVLLLFAVSINAQGLPPDYSQRTNLEKLMTKSEQSRWAYAEVFKDLFADELKTKLFYRADGKIKDKRVIKSLFIVYESPYTRTINEFRNVLEFNGKNVARNENKLTDFFAKIEKIGSDKKVEENLLKESVRFDGGRYAWGITLAQVSPFYEYMRSSFKYKIVGEQKIEGKDVVVIEYNQIKYSSYVQINPTSEEQEKDSYFASWTDIPNDLQPTNPRMSGKVWVDLETGQIWRNEFKVTINPRQLTMGIVVTEDVYEYQSSKFGILLPKVFKTTSYEVKGNNDLTLKVNKSLESTFEYSNFNSVSAEIKKYEVDKGNNQ